MKPRTPGFLSPTHIDHDGEIFDYIRELHDYLWRFVRVVRPGAGGDMHWYLDNVINSLELTKDENTDNAYDPPTII